ncbi:MAG: DUF86 domain-containing protein [Clostridiales bacterium]|nr:DUF86 domain-containing protein [Clostridiales bacterium]
MEKSFEEILIKMKKYAMNAVLYCEEYDYNQFISDRKTIDACVFNISQLGELASLVDTFYRLKYQIIDWLAIKSVRNRIVHDYEGVKMDIIWDIIIYSLPKLIAEIENILINIQKTTP